MERIVWIDPVGERVTEAESGMTIGRGIESLLKSKKVSQNIGIK
jgi:hypothetical protein